MKTFVLFCGLAVVCALLYGCEDMDVASGDTGSWGSLDAYASNDVDFGDDVAKEPDESPPEDVPTAEEVCTPYIGVWYCACVGGLCVDSSFNPTVIVDIFQKDGNVWSLSVKEDYGTWQEDWGTVTCDPSTPPPSDLVTGVVYSLIQTEQGFHLEIRTTDDKTILDCTRNLE